MESLEFHLDDFVGPLDLLLTLIQKHKLDLYDISISTLVEQYMEVMGYVKEEDMDVASEFMEMAARLVYMKSLLLLPRHEEEIAELKSELEGQLIEYQLVQQMAAHLGERYQGQQIFVRAPMDIVDDRPYLVKHRLNDLLEAYLIAKGRRSHRLPPPQKMFTEWVNRPVVSVESREVLVLQKLYAKPIVPFDELFEDSTDSSEAVATFLAVLELVKTGRILFSDDNELVEMAPMDLTKTKGESYEGH